MTEANAASREARAHARKCLLTVADTKLVQIGRAQLVTLLALADEAASQPREGVTFKRGDRVEKVGGASWRGRVVGEYATSLTAEGYAVESENEPGSVQIYPVKALRALHDTAPTDQAQGGGEREAIVAYIRQCAEAFREVPLELSRMGLPDDGYALDAVLRFHNIANHIEEGEHRAALAQSNPTDGGMA
jgi:hypothetical protein